jgi:hypothetical protein
MRQCPTLEGDDRPLIAHMIGSQLCFSRQRTNYHKCHRCVYRGKPADFTPEAVGPPVHRSSNGVVSSVRSGRLELPGTNKLVPRPQP